MERDMIDDMAFDGNTLGQLICHLRKVVSQQDAGENSVPLLIDAIQCIEKIVDNALSQRSYRSYFVISNRSCWLIPDFATAVSIYHSNKEANASIHYLHTIDAGLSQCLCGMFKVQIG